MNDLHVRWAKAGDAAQIVEIHARSIRGLCSGDYTRWQIEAWVGKRTAEEYALRIARHPFFVADYEGKLVGYAVYNVKSFELLSLFVDPDFARQGVASDLVHQLVADARSRGLAALWLYSSITAVPFYEKVGFRSSIETAHIFNGVPLECLRMEMTLTG